MNLIRSAKSFLILALFCFFILPNAAAQTPVTAKHQGAISNSIAEIEQHLSRPPDDSRIMVRWWWFGPSVTREEIEIEMRHMKEGGIGGFELQTVYPLAVDDPARGIRNIPYLSPEFLDLVKFTSRKARELGLRMDLTIGSGWPYGGPYISGELAATRLRSDSREITPGVSSVVRPVPYDGEHLLAAFVGRGALGETDPGSFQELDLSGNGTIVVPKDSGPRTLLFFFSSPTGQAVKRAALGAEGPVLNHYDRAAILAHLRETGDKLMGAVEPQSIYSIFCDSLEAYGADWTSDLLPEFKRRRGYDLKPLLPLLEFGNGDRSADVRRDFGHTLTELYEERFLVPLREWADKNNVPLRMQNYGLPPATLASYRHVNLPEGEGWPWTNLTATRWATSAAHLFAKPVISSETWTWIHSPAFRATPLDVKAEADQHFLMGVNQLIGHGWPYSPPQAGKPGWSLYAAGVLSDKNPWWPVMPDLSLYLQRVSFLLRQGKPVTDVAIYAPNEDAYSSFKPGSENYLDLFRKTVELIGPKIIPAILAAGSNFDLFDDGTLPETRNAGYKTIILPNVRRIPEPTRRWMMERIRDGVRVLAVGRKPDGEWPSLEVQDVADLSRKLSETAPDMILTPSTPDIGFVHRQLPDADIYFLANTGNLPRTVRSHFRTRFSNAESIDPVSGKIERLSLTDAGVELNFESYGSRIVVFRLQAGDAAPAKTSSLSKSEELNTGWRMQLGDATRNDVKLPFSWAEDTTSKYFSGTAVFSNTANISMKSLHPGARIYLDFGDTTPAQREILSTDTIRGYSFATLLTTPIREAATIFVNGKRAGSLWAPPYRTDITDLVLDGSNNIRIEVYNTAINELAEGGGLPDTKSLIEQYGLRFTFQDMENLKPLPSGILSSVQLQVVN